MPGGDRTGPLGQGPFTGRGLGDCPGGAGAGYPRAGAGFGMGFGRGFGRGCGFGRGGGRRFGIGRGFGGWSGPMYGSQKEALSEQKSFLERQLEAVQKELNDLSEE